MEIKYKEITVKYVDNLDPIGCILLKEGKGTIYLKKELLKKKWKNVHERVLQHELQHFFIWKKHGRTRTALHDSIILGDAAQRAFLKDFVMEEICNNKIWAYRFYMLVNLIGSFIPLTREPNGNLGYNDGLTANILDVGVFFMLGFFVLKPIKIMLIG